jgi:rare lipoprotein A (peptidoglycan hydrolase)
MRWAAPAALCATLAIWAAPAQAMTGGAAAPTVGGSQARIAFGSWRSAGATWYGPGLYGRRTACGRLLRPGTLGVAHRRLPCGTAVKFVHHGRRLVTRVIDRGPYTAGNAWDLTNGARLRLDFGGVGKIRYAVERRRARGKRRRG